MVGPDKLEGLSQHSQDMSAAKIPPSKQPMTKTPSKSAPSHQQDSIDLSPENTEYVQLLKRIDEVPNIRHERVEKIRKSLKAGTYHIDPQNVAERILQEIVREGTHQKRPIDRPDSSKAF